MIRRGNSWIPVCPCCRREVKPEGKWSKWPLLCPDCKLHVEVVAGLSIDECTYQAQTGKRCPFEAPEVVCPGCQVTLASEVLEAVPECPHCGASVEVLEEMA